MEPSQVAPRTLTATELPKTRMSLGIDPGFTNLGAALCKLSDQPGKVEVLKEYYHNPSQSKTLVEFTKNFVHEVIKDTRQHGFQEHAFGHVRIERFVSYGNVRSSATEQVTGLIGMLEYALTTDAMLWSWGGNHVAVDLDTYRAVDWKISLVKLLSSKYGFDNPSNQLDKKFSKAAAKFLVTDPSIVKNDHIADAICLAAFPLLR